MRILTRGKIRKKQVPIRYSGGLPMFCVVFWPCFLRCDSIGPSADSEASEFTRLHPSAYGASQFSTEPTLNPPGLRWLSMTGMTSSSVDDVPVISQILHFLALGGKRAPICGRHYPWTIGPNHGDSVQSAGIGGAVAGYQQFRHLPAGGTQPGFYVSTPSSR